MVKKGTVKLKQSPMVLPAAHCAANGDNGTGVSNSNMIDKKMEKCSIFNFDHNFIDKYSRDIENGFLQLKSPAPKSCWFRFYRDFVGILNITFVH